MLYDQRESILVRRLLQDYQNEEYKKSVYIDGLEKVGDLDLSKEKELLKIAIKTRDLEGVGEVLDMIVEKMEETQTPIEKLVDQFSWSANKLLQNYNNEIQFSYYRGQLDAIKIQLGLYLPNEIYKEIKDMNLTSHLNDIEELRICVFEAYNLLCDNLEVT